MGTSNETGLPTEWSSTKNVVWKTKLPGPGTSSPVTVGDRIFLTWYSGYALTVDEPGDVEKLKRHVVCLDRSTGKILWEKEFAAMQPESKYSGRQRLVARLRHQHASRPTTNTCTSSSARRGVFCLAQKDGTEKWRVDVGDKTTGWGSGNSPILFENLLIVNAAIESGTLRALDKNDRQRSLERQRRQGGPQHAEPRADCRAAGRN